MQRVCPLDFSHHRVGRRLCPRLRYLGMFDSSRNSLKTINCLPETGVAADADEVDGVTAEGTVGEGGLVDTVGPEAEGAVDEGSAAGGRELSLPFLGGGGGVVFSTLTCRAACRVGRPFRRTFSSASSSSSSPSSFSEGGSTTENWKDQRSLICDQYLNT